MIVYEKEPRVCARCGAVPVKVAGGWRIHHSIRSHVVVAGET